MRIKSLLTTVRVYDLPTRSLHLPGRGLASGDRCVAEVTEDELASPQLQKAIKRKWVRVLKDKAVTPPETKASAKPKKSMKSEEKPVATTSTSVTAEEPNKGSDE